MAELLWTIFPPFIIYLVFIARRTGYLSPSNLFAYFQLVMVVGTLPMLQHDLVADQLHAFIIVATFLLFLGVTSAFVLLTGKRNDLRFTAMTTITSGSRAIWIVAGLSIVVCVAYYVALGYNVLTSSLVSVLSGSHADLGALRLNAYSGSRYLFPGYVNQFRNVLLPAVTVLLTLSLFRDKSRFRWLLAIVLWSATLIFILGTGQRGAFVTFAIVLVVFIYYLNRAMFKKWAPIVVLAAIPLFFLSTIALGRAKDQLASATGVWGQAVVLFNQTLFRAFGSNQEASVVGFRYVHGLPTQFGGDWLRALVGLLPGVSGSDISNQVYKQMYGSTRGSAPLSLWGSAYYNFGTVGALLLACILAAGLHMLTLRISKMRKINSMELMGMAGVFTILGSWVVSGPAYLLNAGIVAFGFLWLWGSHTAGRWELHRFSTRRVDR